MNAYIQSVILGIVEGLTEFLPVSSTAHLRIAEDLMGIGLKDPYWEMYTIVIQLGAILALPVYFRARIAKFLSTFPKGERGDRTVLTHPLSLTLIAFVVTAVPLLLLKKLIKNNLEEIQPMAWALLIGGIVMWVVDALCKGGKTAHMEEMHLGQAIWIGACQILSGAFPGTSRSMSTIAAGQTAGMTREAALEFSFFLSIPTMLAATGKQLFEAIHPGHGAAAESLAPVVMNTQLWIILLIGSAISFVVALGVVAWFMHWVRKHGFMPFAIYRIALGAFLLFAKF